MRWKLLAMIQEVARHAGHGDVLREQIDQTLPNNPRDENGGTIPSPSARDRE
jgi:hypothetical protein